MSLTSPALSAAGRPPIVAGWCAAVLLLPVADAARADAGPDPRKVPGEAAVRDRTDGPAAAPERRGGPITLPRGGVTDIQGDRRRGFGVVFGSEPGLAVDYVPEARAVDACRASYPLLSNARARCLGGTRTQYAWLDVMEDTLH